MTERAPLGLDHSAALAWLDEELSARDVRRLGEVTMERERPWASVFRVETSAGRLWLKECGPGTGFEAGLYDILGRIGSAHVLTPVAVDVSRAWLILPDGGRLLADETDPARQLDQLADVFAQYAELQRRAAGHVDELLAIGVTDMRPSIMPERFEEALEFVEPYLAHRGSADELQAYQQLRELSGVVAEWSQHLTGSPGGLSLDHNDLHPWNIFYSGEAGSVARFYDWGDAVIAHPFASMLVGLGALTRIHGMTDEDPRIVRLRDAYLYVFADLGPHCELVRTLELACHVGQIARALVWARAVGELGEAAPDTYQTAPMQHLANLLETSYPGRH